MGFSKTPQQAWLSQEGQKVRSPLLKETANVVAAENTESLLWAALINHDSAGDYIHSSLAKKKKNSSQTLTQERWFQCSFLTGFFAPPSQFSFWRNDLMRSQQMRRKGPWGKREGRGREGGLCCPGLGRPPHFLSKGMHKLPAAVLGKLHFNCGPSPEAIISSLISSATARHLLPH